jgi:DNA/RNA endonuclease G (NUC1)
MDRIWNQVKEANDVKVRTMSKTKLQEAYERNMKVNIRNDEYKKAGGYRKYQRDVESLRKEYTSSLFGFNENEVKLNLYDFLINSYLEFNVYTRMFVYVKFKMVL